MKGSDQACKTGATTASGFYEAKNLAGRTPLLSRPFWAIVCMMYPVSPVFFGYSRKKYTVLNREGDFSLFNSGWFREAQTCHVNSLFNKYDPEYLMPARRMQGDLVYLPSKR